mmetsp:Transcript_27648/g.85673  ORF Transcript_27648/g.85673 Transcript_27648/m.85673 type:complete len:216 (-) Transcript_27648:195-842(-)
MSDVSAAMIWFTSGPNCTSSGRKRSTASSVTLGTPLHCPGASARRTMPDTAAMSSDSRLPTIVAYTSGDTGTATTTRSASPATPPALTSRTDTKCPATTASRAAAGSVGRESTALPPSRSMAARIAALLFSVVRLRRYTCGFGTLVSYSLKSTSAGSRHDAAMTFVVATSKTSATAPPASAIVSASCADSVADEKETANMPVTGCPPVAGVAGSA